MAKEIDLSTLNLPAGTHEITVKARASGYTDSSASDPVSYVVAGETVQVSGTWYLNGMLPHSEINENVQFTSNGIHYSNITIMLGDGEVHSPAVTLYMYYDDTLVAEQGHEELIITWVNEAYCTVTFDGVQTVSKEFYDMIADIATQQTFAFTIGVTTYYAEPGMTWSEWVESEYNTGGVYYNPETDYINTSTHKVVYRSGLGYVRMADEIINNVGYAVNSEK